MSKLLNKIKAILSFFILARYLFYKWRFKGIRIHPSVTIDEKGGLLSYEKNNSIGENSRIILTEGSEVHLANNTWLGAGVYLETLKGGAIRIRSNTSLQDRCRIIGDVTIGSNVLFAPNVFVSSGNHFFDVEPSLPIRMQDNLVINDPAYSDIRSKQVVVEDDCWIGTNVVIMQGVKVGKGAIVGANSVVTKDVLPYTIVGGIPAKELKKRLEFNPPVVIKSAVRNHLPYFYTGFILENLQGSSADYKLRMEKEFIIALMPEAGAHMHEIYIKLNAKKSYKHLALNYNGYSTELLEGEHVYRFPVKYLSDFMYKFEFTSEDHPSQVEIYIIEAGLL